MNTALISAHIMIPGMYCFKAVDINWQGYCVQTWAVSSRCIQLIKVSSRSTSKWLSHHTSDNSQHGHLKGVISGLAQDVPACPMASGMTQTGILLLSDHIHCVSSISRYFKAASLSKSAWVINFLPTLCVKVPPVVSTRSRTVSFTHNCFILVHKFAVAIFFPDDAS